MTNKGAIDLKEAILYVMEHPKAVIYISPTYSPELENILVAHNIPVKRTTGLKGNEAIVYDAASTTFTLEYMPLAPEDIVPLKPKKETV